MLRVLPFLVFLILALFLWRGLTIDPRLLPSALIDQPVPAFDLPLLENKQSFTQKELLGHVSLLNVWASWCPSCRAEHGILMAIANSKKVSLYGLDYKDSRDDGLGWLREEGNPYQAVIFDEQGKLAMDLGVYGTPETYLIDSKGVIRYRYLGPLTAEVWENKLLPLINKLQKDQ